MSRYDVASFLTYRVTHAGELVRIIYYEFIFLKVSKTVLLMRKVSNCPTILFLKLWWLVVTLTLQFAVLTLLFYNWTRHFRCLVFFKQKIFNLWSVCKLILTTTIRLRRLVQSSTHCPVKPWAYSISHWIERFIHYSNYKKILNYIYICRKYVYDLLGLTMQKMNGWM